MKWSVMFLRGAELDLKVLDSRTRRSIIHKLEWLSENFEVIIPITLTGEFGDFYKLRVGNMRVFYKADT